MENFLHQKVDFKEFVWKGQSRAHVMEQIPLKVKESPCSDLSHQAGQGEWGEGLTLQK